MQTHSDRALLAEPEQATVSSLRFRNAMSRLGAAVHVVTSEGSGGKVGFSASAICSVTDSPATVLVCLNRSSSAWPAVTANEVVCINTLSAEQQAMSAAFAGRTTMTERFLQGEWSERPGRAPALSGAVMSLDCRVVNSVNVGTHAILICEVIDIIDNERDSNLIYFNRQYHSLQVI